MRDSVDSPPEKNDGMTTLEFLAHLRDLGVTATVGGGRLRVNAPESVLTASLRGELARRKAEIVAFLAQSVESPPGGLPPIVPVSRDGRLPASFSQQRLWFLDQLVPNNAAYNMPFPMRVKGPLDPLALQRTLTEIVRRHESLRTTFAETDGEPVQVIASPAAVDVPIPIVDLSTLSDEQAELEARRLVTEESVRPFDLARGPLLRVALLKLGANDHVLLLLLHHIVFDGWSMAVLFREMAAYYHAIRSGERAAVAELSIQYADYAAWQRERLEGDVLKRHLAYWKRQLADAPPYLDLPTDRPRPPVQTYRGATVSAELPADLCRALRALGREEEATLFMTLVAAFALLLSRHAAQEDLVIGTPAANRDQPQVENLIGLFLNTLALRCRLSGDPTFREWLRRVKETVLGAHAHRELPFEKLVEQLRPARDLSRSPVFQVMFDMISFAADDVLQLDGLSLAPFPWEPTRSKFDMTLYATEHKEEVSLLVAYNSDLFEESTVRRLLAHYPAVLESVVADPDRRLSAIPLASEEEYRQLLRALTDDFDAA